MVLLLLIEDGNGFVPCLFCSFSRCIGALAPNPLRAEGRGAHLMIVMFTERLLCLPLRRDFVVSC